MKKKRKKKEMHTRRRKTKYIKWTARANSEIKFIYLSMMETYFVMNKKKISCKQDTHTHTN